MSDIEEVEQTCWYTVTFLLTIAIAAFGYRFFGPDNAALNEDKKEEKAEEVKKPLEKSVVEVIPEVILISTA